MPRFIEPNATDTEGFFEFFRYINQTATGGLFMPIILLVIWLVVFIATLLTTGIFSKRTAAGSWTLASFIAFILSIPLVLMDFLQQNYMYLSLVLLGFGIVWVFLADASD